MGNEVAWASERRKGVYMKTQLIYPFSSLLRCCREVGYSCRRTCGKANKSAECREIDIMKSNRFHSGRHPYFS